MISQVLVYALIQNMTKIRVYALIQNILVHASSVQVFYIDASVDLLLILVYALIQNILVKLGSVMKEVNPRLS